MSKPTIIHLCLSYKKKSLPIFGIQIKMIQTLCLLYMYALKCFKYQYQFNMRKVTVTIAISYNHLICIIDKIK